MKSADLTINDLAKADFGVRGYYATLALILLFSLWLRAGFPILAFAGPHDDLLFVHMAATIGAGNWLGDYNNLTLAKGAAYSVFLLANHVTGLPLKFSEHLLYLLAALFFASILGRLYAAKWATLVAFALLAFIPTAWDPEPSGRIVRECLYVSLSLFLLALAVRCFVPSKSTSVADELREKRLFLVLLGFVAGIYWLTREEGVWLLPSGAILIACWLWSRRIMLRPWRVTAFFLVLPLIPALLVVGTVNTINYFKYGVFRNNDFRSAVFQAAYGALSRIKHDHWQRFVFFPKDARERAYRLSPAVRELQPYFDGAIGENWRKNGCNQTDINRCPEIRAGWLIWALRDMVAAAGYYRSAKDADVFYTRLASEVNAACDQHPGECLPYRQTLMPPWRNEYLLDTARTSWEVFVKLITLNGAHIGVGGRVSTGLPGELALMNLISNGPLVPPEQSASAAGQTAPKLVSKRDRIRYQIAENLAKAENIISKYGVPVSIVTWLAWVIVAIRRRKLDAGLVISSALVAAVGARVLLLGFLEATSMPGANNMLYLSPVAPMALALIPTGLFGVIAFLKKNAWN